MPRAVPPLHRSKSTVRDSGKCYNGGKPVENKALQRVLDDIRDGLQGLVSRTEFHRFLDELERENTVLSATCGHRQQRLLGLAERIIGGDAALTGRRNAERGLWSSNDALGRGMPGIWPQDEIWRWILGTVSLTSTASSRLVVEDRHCRWVMCDRPEQVIAFVRALPRPLPDNFVFVTPIYVETSEYHLREDQKQAKHHREPQSTRPDSCPSSPQPCDKQTALAMLLVDLISTFSRHATDETVFDGLRKADMPNIRSPEGRIQALIIVLDICLKVASRHYSHSSQACPAGLRNSRMSFQDGKHPRSTGGDQSEQSLLIVVDRIDAVVGPETEHYVKKMVLLLKQAASPASGATTGAGAFSVHRGTSTHPLMSRFHLSHRALSGPSTCGAGGIAGSTCGNARGACPTIRVLFTIVDEAGRQWLEQRCGISPVTEASVLDRDAQGMAGQRVVNHDGTVQTRTHADEKMMSQASAHGATSQAGDREQIKKELRNCDENTQKKCVGEADEDLWAVRPSLLSALASPTGLPTPNTRDPRDGAAPSRSFTTRSAGRKRSAVMQYVRRCASLRSAVPRAPAQPHSTASEDAEHVVISRNDRQESKETKLLAARKLKWSRLWSNYLKSVGARPSSSSSSSSTPSSPACKSEFTRRLMRGTAGAKFLRDLVPSHSQRDLRHPRPHRHYFHRVTSL
ncbi:uncharacterized protein B0I36DRAFT_402671 [Microdochium trichocladiopsis]|uniref:Uncharacterized protein n=1 Tax=Microdochium trichocladiopsis TaxID=1682393 RepID=A0A9P8YD62_9PEZI|nr:uncharacterized protein B0I36DRAFT_402671 [Microdochium trichocladiopsis]KAH7037158.1 hypothetical protein B0I36DRAFT_402671 [Microdochium trichocladiopsis]